MLPAGLWPVMLTPFKENNEVDYEGLKGLVEFYLSAGADGLFANCLSSEMFQLTDQERYLITKTVVKTVNGKVPVIATGTFNQNVDVNSSFIRKLHDTGVGAVVINTNQLSDGQDDDGIFNRKTEGILNHTQDIPLGLYECPQPYKRLLSAGAIKRLAQTGRFVYHKDTSCNLSAIKQKIEAIKGTALGFYNANTQSGWDSLKAGGRGMSPIAANFYPELFSYLIGHWQHEGKRQDLKKVNAFLTVSESVVDNCYPLSAKIFLKKRGLKINVNTRVPSGAMAYQDYLKIDALLELFDDLVDRVGIDKLAP